MKLIILFFPIILTFSFSVEAQVTTVDSAIGAGKYTSIALDNNGNPHISYFFEDGNVIDGVKYAYFSNGAWQTIVVDSDTEDVSILGRQTSIVLDSSSIPHIAYQIFYQNLGSIESIKHAWLKDGTWETEFADKALRDASINAGKDNKIYIAYYGVHYFVTPTQTLTAQYRILHDPKISQDSLKYAYSDSSPITLTNTTSSKNGKYMPVWNLTDISTNSVLIDQYQYGTGKYVSSALDSSGNLHIAYCYFSRDSRYLMYTSSPEWKNEMVDIMGNTYDLYLSLKLDSSDHPHISYNNDVTQDLKYAYFDGSSWNTEVIDSAGNVGEHNSLALDNSGNPYIVYYDSYRDALKCAYRKNNQWNTEIVDSYKVGQYGSVAIGNNGILHISYFDYGNNHLKYAKYVPGSVVAVPSHTTIRIVPNPVKPAIASIMTFSSLPEKAKAAIYNIAGELVIKLNDEDNNSKIIWDIKNSAGRTVSSGIYIIVCSSENGEKITGKFAVIK